MSTACREGEGTAGGAHRHFPLCTSWHKGTLPQQPSNFMGGGGDGLTVLSDSRTSVPSANPTYTSCRRKGSYYLHGMRPYKKQTSSGTACSVTNTLYI